MNLYIQHNTSGEMYAVQISDQNTILAACGPLHHSECTTENIETYQFNDEPELAEWVQEHRQDFHATASKA